MLPANVSYLPVRNGRIIMPTLTPPAGVNFTLSCEIHRQDVTGRGFSGSKITGHYIMWPTQTGSWGRCRASRHIYRCRFALVWLVLVFKKVENL